MVFNVTFTKKDGGKYVMNLAADSYGDAYRKAGQRAIDLKLESNMIIEIGLVSPPKEEAVTCHGLFGVD